MKLSSILKTILLIAFFTMPALLHAQNQGEPPPAGEDPGAPIDGGLSLLLAAGAAYGIKKYRDGKRKQNEDAGQDLK